MDSINFSTIILHESLFSIYFCFTSIVTLQDKNQTVVKYTLPEDTKTIFSSEYKLHMPTEQELIGAVEEEKKNFELKSRKYEKFILNTIKTTYNFLFKRIKTHEQLSS